MTEEYPLEDKEEYGFPDNYTEQLDSIQQYRDSYKTFYNDENLIQEVLEE